MTNGKRRAAGGLIIVRERLPNGVTGYTGRQTNL
jgi:hypothetical protein